MIGEAIAQASTLTPDERSVNVVSDPTQSSDEYVIYAPAAPHATFNRTEYAAAQAPTTQRAPVILNVTAALSGLPDDYNQDPELVDITQQLPGADISQTEEIASLATDLLRENVATWVDTVNYSPDNSDRMVSLISGRVVSMSTEDTTELGWPGFDAVNNTVSAVDQLVELSDESGVAIVNYHGDIRVALDGAESNENIGILPVIDGPTGQDMARIEQAGVSGYGDDTTEVWDDLRSHARYGLRLPRILKRWMPTNAPHRQQWKQYWKQ